MMINKDNYNRVQLKDFIKHIESKFAINEWKLNGIHLWPIIRISLYFYVINLYESNNAPLKSNSHNTPKSLVRSFKTWLFLKRMQIRFRKFVNSLQNRDKIYFGANSHRVIEDEVFFNRFFDAQRINNKDMTSYYYFEYAYINDKKYFKPENVLNFKQYLNSYIANSKHRCDLKLNKYEDFIQFLSSNNDFGDFIKRWDVEAWQVKAKSFSAILEFYTTLFKKVKPKEISYLCYYNSPDIMLSVAVANRLGIVTKEMQHGPQTDTHLAYGSWYNIPEKGYDMLPRNFMVWEQSTSDILNKWMHKTSLYSSIEVGHPWIEYLRTKTNVHFEKPILLYCLQPSPVTLEESFTEPIIETIQASDYTWYIRLHPRQLDQYETVKQFLLNKGIWDYVEVDRATTIPLPVLIDNSLAVLTLFSGSVLEAAMMGKHAVILSELGRDNFRAQIEAGVATYIDSNASDFTAKLQNIIAQEKKHD